MKQVAFFDVDGTIYRDSLLIEIFKKFTKYGILSEEMWVTKVKPAFDRWDNRKGSYETYLNDLAEMYQENIKGTDKHIIDYISNQIIKEKADRVYRYTRDRIKWHKDQGHLVIAISGSPHILVEKFARHLEFDDYIGTKYHYDSDDHFNGEIEPMWDRDNKQKSINYFKEKYDLDLSNSYAYGDTTGDITMFELVGNPIAFNPNANLINYLNKNDELKNKIDMIVERKDVIYNIPTKLMQNKPQK
ncbi:MAG: HAD-IB family hydrolase [Clostridia bacterium]|jgi:HAD superfamily hydrolase (TIGR01490 family)|nr:HAD-IB family hydrolase [Clostridia bacterium]